MESMLLNQSFCPVLSADTKKNCYNERTDFLENVHEDGKILYSHWWTAKCLCTHEYVRISFQNAMQISKLGDNN
jgi:hypothetical protein